jgi:hypothetical protein
MNMKEQTVAEMQRRVKLLPDELAEWKTLTVEKMEDFGIHTSQIEAINDFFDERIALHEEYLVELQNAANDDDLAYWRSELEAELGGAHGLMMVFRNILAQRFDTDRYRDTLDAADLIAADCYRPCIAQVVKWHVLEDGQFRVPPLTFLNARSSPQALSRGKKFRAFGFDLDSREMSLSLPFSFVSLRYHDTAALWTYCTIHHEVGHLLDQDLGLAEELGQLLTESPGPGIDAQRVPAWSGWLKETIADAFGVLLGGAGFAYTLADLLFLPASEALQSPAGGEHPPPYLRVFLLGALLRRTLVPELDHIAGEIEENWQSIYGGPPALQEPYLEDCAAMAKLLLSTHLRERLQVHRLRNFVPHLDQDHERVVSLSAYLCNGGLAPDAATFPMRLAPAAARLAVHKVQQGHSSAYADIHKRALDFALSIPHDEIMAPGGLEPEQKQYLRALARRVRFGDAG